MPIYPFATSYTCGSFPSKGTRMPSATISTRTNRFFRNRSGSMIRTEPGVLYHVQAVEYRGPEGTFLHLVLEHASGASVIEVPIQDTMVWNNVSLN